MSEALAANQEQMNRVMSEIGMLRDELELQAQAISEAREEFAALRTQITSLSRYVSQSLALDEGELAPIALKLSPSLLATGIYILASRIHRELAPTPSEPTAARGTNCRRHTAAVPGDEWENLQLDGVGACS